MKKFNFSKYCPLGYNFESEKNTYLTVLICSVVYSLLFFVRYLDGYGNLYSYRNGKRYLVPGRMMPEFHTLTNGIFYGFFIIFFILVAFIFLRYAYHYQGTKSIYTMKRLPEKNDLHIRCIVLPIAAILISIIIIFIILLLDLAFYMIFTPKQCLYPFSWQSFWRALI